MANKQNNKPKTIEEQLGIPKTEKVCEQDSSDGVLKYVKTYKDPLRDVYYLYEIIDGKAVKTKWKADNPVTLDKWIKLD